MGLTHLLIGLVEGFFTAGVQEFIERLNIDNTQELTTKKLRPLLLFILALIILTPLGLLATGTAFAECQRVGRKIGSLSCGSPSAKRNVEWFLIQCPLPRL